jgi:hypothetical protein
MSWNWLDKIATCDTVYIYNASLICEDCAEEIKKELNRKGITDNGDSDGYPQGPYHDGGGEADSANFCDNAKGCVNAINVAGHKIGCPLSNTLTKDGVDYVRETVMEKLFDKKEFGRKIGRLLLYFWRDYLNDGSPRRAKPGWYTTIPVSLNLAIGRYMKNVSRDNVHLDNLMCDCDNVYLIAHPSAGVVDLVRCPVDDDGNFKEAQVVSIPSAVANGKEPIDLITEAASEGAWD